MLLLGASGYTAVCVPGAPGVPGAAQAWGEGAVLLGLRGESGQQPSHCIPSGRKPGISAGMLLKACLWVEASQGREHPWPSGARPFGEDPS